jgi:predicted DNA-binding transcriptional regulator AlpA
MGSSRSLFSSSFFCEYCQKETKFLAIHFAIALTGRSRSTLYRWMEREWIHWRELPSGRRLICQESLSQTHQIDILSTSAPPKRSAPSRPTGSRKAV